VYSDGSADTYKKQIKFQIVNQKWEKKYFWQNLN
jgi:hypothetical protein